ncbi:hypothetical protein CEXT_342191 [Caerostris extrusa]|uniref:Uncharacterized protein n=1 Tax=Caerostris extrusa TaxID=172846 RepID=A0AAV4V162_CAEEX|nr:hypothetical protein CEXT_342191 [Caerostris extrusa]
MTRTFLINRKILYDPSQRNITKWPSISVHTGLDPLPPVHSSALDDPTFDMKVSDASRETAEGSRKTLTTFCSHTFCALIREAVK